jgi:hypothetical protein
MHCEAIEIFGGCRAPSAPIPSLSNTIHSLQPDENLTF